MQVTFNGAPREVAENTTVAALLAELNLQARHCAVEVNRQVVPREQHAQHMLRAGDDVEVVTLVGGG